MVHRDRYLYALPVSSSPPPAVIIFYLLQSFFPLGLACDPDTGEVIPCTPDYVRPPTRIYRYVFVEIYSTFNFFSFLDGFHRHYVGLINAS